MLFINNVLIMYGLFSLLSKSFIQNPYFFCILLMLEVVTISVAHKKHVALFFSLLKMKK